MTKSKTSISVFLPIFNEQGNIKKCVLSVNKYLNKRFKDYEILIISDGSTDNTNKIAKELARKDQRIKLFIRNKKLGYGAGLKSGFSHSSKELIFYTDGDNQFNIGDIDILLPMLSTYDIISGYRIDRKDPLMRILIAFVYNILIRILFNLNVKDIDSAFKLYKKGVFKNMSIKANTGLVDAEVLIKAKKNGFKIGQVGVKHYSRTEGRTIYEIGMRNNIVAFVKPRVIIDILKEIKTLWPELR